MKKFDIMTCYSGSLAYGTNLPTSDTDIRGLFCAEKKYIRTPFYNVKEVTLEEEEDGKVYELTNFMKLFSEMNPNIIELLFVDKTDVITTSEVYEFLRVSAPHLLTKKVAFSFSGYAMSQLKRIRGHDKWISNPQPEKCPSQFEFFRMVHNYTEEKIMGLDTLQHALKQLNPMSILIPYGNGIYGVVVTWNSPGMFNPDGSIRKLEYSRISDEDKKRQPCMIVKYMQEEHKQAKEKHRNYWQWKENRNPSRHQLEVDFGYDTKHAMHLVRLMRMAKEILTTGQVNVKRPDAKELLEIRGGKWTLDELLEWAEDMDQQIQGPLYKQSDLRHSADMNMFAYVTMTAQDMSWARML